MDNWIVSDTNNGYRNSGVQYGLLKLYDDKFYLNVAPPATSSARGIQA